MQSPNPSSDFLDGQFAELRAAARRAPAENILSSVSRRTRQQRRQSWLAFLGGFVALAGALHFAVSSDLVAFVALVPVAALLFRAGWQLGGKAAVLDSTKGGASLFDTWVRETRRELAQATIGPVLAGLFAALTAWVVWRHGFPTWKSGLFVVTAVGICTHAAYLFFVVRPRLSAELAELSE